jgi:hypothetical protein
LTEAAADAYRALLGPVPNSKPTPYQSAAVAALRKLTGKDAAPTAAAWRAVLAQGKTEK